MFKYTHDFDEPLGITAYVVHCSGTSLAAANSLVAIALERNEDREVVQRLVDEAVGFRRAYDVQSRVHQIALGYRAPAFRLPRPQ